MAETRAVWGIDIGKAGLKAVKLNYAEAAEQVVATAFDYVPHPKILSQPDAVPEELVRQALETFLGRNDVRGDGVAISVPGQTALARFIQLPPVESSKVSEIIKYEARQQIPFALEEVIWDYQALGGGTEEGGYMLEAEVGLFAMKRDQLMQHLQPFLDSKLEVDLIQIAPLALYNYLSYDRLGIRPGQEAPGSDEYTILLDMGADDTVLLVTNGEKIWIRNVPIGGNHFTRALTKEMKLTFAKAEHLKCNATKSPDPKAVFQALRPVFNDYVSEIQRSIGYFSSVNRNAKITRVLGLGNGFKLAGLQKFLQQNLQYEVERIDRFQALAGSSVVKAGLFQENVLSFAVPYGLALQGLGRTRIRTSLLPPEIRTARTIRAKKPWAVAAAASLLMGLSLSAFGYATVAESVSEDRWSNAESSVGNLTSTASRFQSEYSSAKSEHDSIMEQRERLAGNLHSQRYWLELYKAINACLPRPQGEDRDETDPSQREQVRLLAVKAEKVDDLSSWFQELPADAKRKLPDHYQNSPPQGAGYLVTLQGETFYHISGQTPGRLFIRNSVLKNLQQWTVTDDGFDVPVGKIGISHPVLISAQSNDYTPGTGEGGSGALASGAGYGNYAGGGQGAGPGRSQGYGNNGQMPQGYRREQGAGPSPGFGEGFNRRGGDATSRPLQSPEDEDDSEPMELNRTTFEIKFVWKETPPAERSEQPPWADSQQSGTQATGTGLPGGSP